MGGLPAAKKFAFGAETRGKERRKATSRGLRGSYVQAMQIDGSDYAAFTFVSFHHSSLFSSDHICISYIIDPSTRLHSGCAFSGKAHGFILNENSLRFVETRLDNKKKAARYF